jgi:hypothetical protein
VSRKRFRSNRRRFARVHCGDVYARE